MKSHNPGGLCEIREHLSGSGVSGQDREVREWDFLFKGIMFGWMRLREGEGQWS